MPRPTPIAVGQKWGRLTVISEGPHLVRRSGNLRQWLCKCDCGSGVLVRTNYLTGGDTRSCGCLNADLSTHRSRKHGASGTRLYTAWANMKARCLNPADKRYADYGGRGVSICAEWVSSFEAFRDWALGNGYGPDLSIDRIDVDGDYEPGNCRWATRREQMQNLRKNVHVTAWGETKILAEWVRDPRCGVAGPYAITTRLRRGMTPEDAISKPGRKQKASA